MADQMATGTSHTANFEDSFVGLSGSVSARTVQIRWDNADDKLTLMDGFERARNEFLKYLMQRV